VLAFYCIQPRSLCKALTTPHTIIYNPMWEASLTRGISRKAFIRQSSLVGRPTFQNSGRVAQIIQLATYLPYRYMVSRPCEEASDHSRTQVAGHNLLLCSIYVHSLYTTHRVILGSIWLLHPPCARCSWHHVRPCCSLHHINDLFLC
jgi:hypothetical protein